MPLFSYQAIDASGNLVRGLVEAPTEAVLLGQVEEKRLTLVSVAESVPRRAGEWSPLARRVSKKQLANYSTHLAAMLGAGLPLVAALETLGAENDNPLLGRVSLEMVAAVRDGQPFSAALAAQPEVFPRLYTAMVRAGEESGALPTILSRMAEFLEKESEVAAKLRDALAYPAIVASVAVIVSGAMLGFVIPRFLVLLEKVGAQIPWPTRVLMLLSDLVTKRWYLILGAALLAAAASRAVFARPGARRWLDAAKLRVPVVGPLLLRVAAARFARTLGTMLDAGLPILASLEHVRRVMGNSHLEAVIGKVTEEIRDGAGISAPLRRARIFPPMLLQMVHVGETSGTLDAMLNRVADLYEKEVDRAAKRLSIILEPAMILGIGVGVGFVALALLLPMVRAIGTMGKS